MQVVEVRRKTEPLNRAFDIFFDMRGGICNGAVSSKDIEATFRGN
jgi:hypothetical protein